VVLNVEGDWVNIMRVLESKPVFGSKQTFRWIIDNIVWIILIFIVALFSLTIDGYVSIPNYINIVYHSVFIGVLAIAISYCLVSGHIDLSVESMAGFGAIVSAWLAGSSTFASGYLINPYLTLLIVLLIGALVGSINAFFILKLNINAFLVTLSTYIIVRGMALLLTGGQGVSRLPDSFRLIDTIKLVDIPLMVYLMFVFYIFFQFVLQRTRFGRHIYVIGGNPTAAYNFGINVRATILKVFILSGILAGFTGWLIAARTNGATPSSANGFLFETLAAVIIGGVSMTGGIGSLSGVIGGVLLLSAIHSALNLLAISPFVTEVIRGGLVLIAIVLDSLKRLLR
jgi:ribose transport system permease protein